MVLKRKVTINKIRRSEEYPVDVKRMLNSCCFFMMGSIDAISVDQKNIADYKNARKEFDKDKHNNTEKPLLFLGTNPYTLLDIYTPIDHFPSSCHDDDFVKEALIFLQANKLISRDVQEDQWLYIMGHGRERPEKLNKLKWLGTKENLRLFLTLWYERELNNKYIKLKDICKHVPLCFLDKNENPMCLAKKRKELSGNSDLIEKFFRPN